MPGNTSSDGRAITPAELSELSGRAPAEIEALDLIGMGISDISALACCHALKKLRVDSNALTAFAGVEELPELQTLSAQHNALSALDGLRGLPKLAILNVSYNRLATLGTALREAGALKVLLATDNELKRLDLHLLKKLEQLNTIVASRNRIAEIAGADKLVSLRKLSLAHNELRTLGPLPSSLVELRLSHNRLAALPQSLAGCPRLALLDVGSNQLNSLDQLSPLKDLERLRNLTLRGNPLADGRDALGSAGGGYRPQTKRLLPRLRLLDGLELGIDGYAGANRKVRFDAADDGEDEGGDGSEARGGKQNGGGSTQRHTTTAAARPPAGAGRPAPAAASADARPPPARPPPADFKKATERRASGPAVGRPDGTAARAAGTGGHGAPAAGKAGRGKAADGSAPEDEERATKADATAKRSAHSASRAAARPPATDAASHGAAQSAKPKQAAAAAAAAGGGGGRRRAGAELGANAAHTPAVRSKAEASSANASAVAAAGERAAGPAAPAVGASADGAEGSAAAGKKRKRRSRAMPGAEPSAAGGEGDEQPHPKERAAARQRARQGASDGADRLAEGEVATGIVALEEKLAAGARGATLAELEQLSLPAAGFESW